LDSLDFQIVRKPPEKLKAMMQPVYDNDYVAPELLKAGVAPRWQPWAAGGVGPWKPAEDQKSFEASGDSPGTQWLRYQHLLPDFNLWQDVLNGKKVRSPEPSLISDFYAYNDGGMSLGCDRQRAPDSYWVGDLALDCQLDVKNDKGAVILELVKGGLQFRCQIEIATGEAKLSVSDHPEITAKAKTDLRGPGTYKVRFSNADNQMLLWVNDKLATFDSETSYEGLHNFQPVRNPPIPGSDQPTDLSPVGIAVQGGASLAVSHLAIWRDIFYISVTDGQGGPRIYDIQPDHFMMLGDNSPESKDSRFWSGEQFVKRDLLIGKALFIYWPHSWWPSWAISIPVGEMEFRLPFWPNFKQMKFVH
jgi:signal peptidase I